MNDINIKTKHTQPDPGSPLRRVCKEAIGGSEILVLVFKIIYVYTWRHESTQALLQYRIPYMRRMCAYAHKRMRGAQAMLKYAPSPSHCCCHAHTRERVPGRLGGHNTTRS